jgi:hypothetical protein
MTIMLQSDFNTFRGLSGGGIENVAGYRRLRHDADRVAT